MSGEFDGSFPEGWAILELMGHRRLAGYVSEAQVAGTAMLRLDVPGHPGGDTATGATQFYSASALYCITPTTEETARRVAAALAAPEPVSRWEIPARAPAVPVDREDFIDSADDAPEDVPF